MASSCSPYWTAQRGLEAVLEALGSRRRPHHRQQRPDSRRRSHGHAQHSAIQSHWSKVFAAKPVDTPAMQQYLGM
eukprot:3232604-Pyramimonas_sp.AAC.1